MSSLCSVITLAHYHIDQLTSQLFNYLTNQKKALFYARHELVPTLKKNE
uniref:Uncharacterized protein n=1 Tax=Sphingobacterium sp. (strain 21) TaxID=743722 RepID=F4C932_SPHS2